MLTSRIFSRARPFISRTWAIQSRQLAHKTRVVERELPPAAPKSRKPWLIGGAIVGTAVWIVGLSTALNYQRLSSSVVTGTLFMVRYDPRVIELLGPQIDYADNWPWITGTVNHFKGKVAIAFDISSNNGKSTLGGSFIRGYRLTYMIYYRRTWTSTLFIIA